MISHAVLQPPVKSLLPPPCFMFPFLPAQFAKHLVSHLPLRESHSMMKRFLENRTFPLCKNNSFNKLQGCLCFVFLLNQNIREDWVGELTWFIISEDRREGMGRARKQWWENLTPACIIEAPGGTEGFIPHNPLMLKELTSPVWKICVFGGNYR